MPINYNLKPYFFSRSDSVRHLEYDEYQNLTVCPLSFIQKDKIVTTDLYEYCFEADTVISICQFRYMSKNLYANKPYFTILLDGKYVRVFDKDIIKNRPIPMKPGPKINLDKIMLQTSTLQKKKRKQPLPPIPEEPEEIVVDRIHIRFD